MIDCTRAIRHASLSWLSLVGICILPSCGMTQPPTGARALDLAAYRLTFDEPFDHLDVSASGPGTRWTAHTPWSGDFGDARFIDPTRQKPFGIADGMLNITMARSQGHWESGLLSSADPKGGGFTQAGGYFEIRAKLPPGPGVWPSFWLGAKGKTGETVPEIDVFEYYGKFPGSFRATIHLWQDGKSLYGKSDLIDVQEGSLTKEFHTYGVSIDAKFITFYLDRQPVAQEPSDPRFLHPLGLLLDLGAGSGWPIDQMQDPSVMTVDYVRAYQKRP
jgi:beta-glucanase (GH16 family)